MTIHACILGATGYGGGELLRLLGAHPAVARADGVSRTRAGAPFHTVHPHLRAVVDGTFTDAPDFATLAAAERPVLFSAMPHGEFAKAWPALWTAIDAAGLDQRVTVIDLSGDFRLRDADAYRRHYGWDHPCPGWLGKFQYGLPEMNCGSGTPYRDEDRGSGTPYRDKDRGSGTPYRDGEGRFISNPGCFATAIELALLPLAALPDPGFIAVTGVTGSTGSGATPSQTTHHPGRAHDFRAYKLGGHQHLGEVEQLLGPRSIGFVAHSAPLVRGIFVTAQFALPPGTDAAALEDSYADCYRYAPFVRRVDGSPCVAAVVGSNFCDIGLHVRDGHVVVMAALDNLVKGMAGQAVQNMNLALGLDETTGLLQAPLYP